MTYINVTLRKIWQHIIDNSALIGKALSAIWFFFAGIHVYIYAVIALTIVDVVTGVMPARKKGEEITSRKLRKGLLEKFGLYMILMLAVFILDLVLKSVFHHTSFYLSLF